MKIKVKIFEEGDEFTMPADSILFMDDISTGGNDLLKVWWLERSRDISDEEKGEIEDIVESREQVLQEMG